MLDIVAVYSGLKYHFSVPSVGILGWWTAFQKWRIFSRSQLIVKALAWKHAMLS